jgi:lactoylglutathione lyase
MSIADSFESLPSRSDRARDDLIDEPAVATAEGLGRRRVAASNGELFAPGWAKSQRGVAVCCYIRTAARRRIGSPVMRILHTMIRVANLDASKQFYCESLGMKVLREQEYPDGKFTLCFLGYGSEAETSVIELTYNWGKTDYVVGDAWGHVAIGSDDIKAAVERVRASGGKVTREPGPMKHGTTVIAFVDDPDGHKIELIERR